MEEKICTKMEIDTFDDKDRSDAFDYPIDIKYEPLAIKNEPAVIDELKDGSILVNNIFIAKPEVDIGIKIEGIGIIHWHSVQRKCDICGECFYNGLDLVAHRHTHTDDTCYTCCICNCNAFHFKPDLHRHMLNVHFNLTSKLPISAKLNTPKTSCNSGKSYHCDICNRGFSYTSDLNRHKRIHTGMKPYECDVCHKCFFKKPHLTQHKRIHTGEKPYECDICHKSFNCKEKLAQHKRIHTGEKPYECVICHKSFNNKPNLTRHKRIHTGEKPYVCDVCRKSFNNKTDLTKHKHN